MSTMTITISGVGDLMAALEEKLGKADSGAVISDALQRAAEPLRDQMIANIDSGGHVRTGKLRRAIRIGTVTRGKNGYQIKVGVVDASAPHARLVEFGHGGPKPAPEHPYMRPAYEATKDQALEIMTQALREALGI